MNIKWKVLIVSMLIYQIILTFVVLNLSHYSQWLHFSDSYGSFPNSWLEVEGRLTLPMSNALTALGISFFILAIINVIVFKKNEESE